MPLIQNQAKNKSLIKRNMQSKSSVIGLVTKLTRPVLAHPQGSYATRSINEAEKIPKDSQALLNNPPLKSGARHKELHRTNCGKKGCLDKDCNPICDTPVNREAVGHATHGKSPVSEMDKKTVPVFQTDLDGNNKPQSMVMYKKPHKTSTTPEHVKGTKKLNSEPKMKKDIMDNENKS